MCGRLVQRVVCSSWGRINSNHNHRPNNVWKISSESRVCSSWGRKVRKNKSKSIYKLIFFAYKFQNMFDCRVQHSRLIAHFRPTRSVHYFWQPALNSMLLSHYFINVRHKILHSAAW